ncbi:MAG: hypothetical protein NTZ73_00005 [Candidatus Diapherotrites archaeon]|nr:hypothetical protein [Candidatus Diapherotrites archaeon]
MEAKNQFVNIKFDAEKILFACRENFRTYNKLRLKGRGTRDYHYLINVPRLYIGGKYSPGKRYSVMFGENKENNHQLVVIDLDDQKEILMKK